MHAGHFIQAHGHASTKYDPRNIHGQCVSCNKWKHGNLVVYTLAMQKTYGVEFVKKLYAKGNLTKQWDRKQLQQLCDVLSTRPEDYEKEYDKSYNEKAG
jgi:hypothetical protein